MHRFNFSDVKLLRLKWHTCLPADVLEAYQMLVETGKVKPDPSQYRCAQRFQALFDELLRHGPAVSRFEEEAKAYMQKRREVRQRLAARESERAKAEGARGGGSSQSVCSV